MKNRAAVVLWCLFSLASCTAECRHRGCYCETSDGLGMDGKSP